MDKQTVIFVKAFHYMTTPLGFTFILISLAMLMFFLGKHRLKTYTIYFALLFLWFCATPITSNWLLKQYFSLSGLTDQCLKKSCQYDAIVVAGYMKPYAIEDPKLGQFWSERLWHARNFYSPNIPIIVISSQYPTPPAPNKNQLSYAKQTLLSWKVKNNDIIITKAARTTREAMLNAYSELVKTKAKNVLLVGYKLRLNRKLLSIEKIEQQRQQGIKFIPTFANHTISARSVSPIVVSNWLPSEDSLFVSRHVLHEFAALIAYRAGNWI